MTMYREEIERYIDAHTQEMLEDIKSICAIDSQRSAYKEGMPFGEGPARALGVAISRATPKALAGPSQRGNAIWRRTCKGLGCCP